MAASSALTRVTLLCALILGLTSGQPNALTHEEIHDFVPAQPPIESPPPRQQAGVASLGGLSAPEITNQGHDFVALRWNPRDGVPSGYRMYSSRWLPSFVARRAPDLTGIYTIDGETVEVCTRRDGTLGEGRMAMYLHSEDGGFSAFGAGRWDTRQGGYSGVMIHSNDTAQSGPLLLYAHRDGWLRMRTGSFVTAADFPHLLAGTPARHLGRLTHGLPPEHACGMMPPPPRQWQTTADQVFPELTGRWVSNYNESIAICTRNGSLISVFSGQDYVQGFAAAQWVSERSRWEGEVAEIRAVRPFWWRLDPDGGKLRGLWEAYNRTWEPAINQTVIPEWEARRDNMEIEPLPYALAGHGLNVEHVCALLDAADSGSGPSAGDVADGWARSAIEQASAPALRGEDRAYSGFGAGFFEYPAFEQRCGNVTVNQTRDDGSTFLNVSTVCADVPGSYDSSGFYRRTIDEQRYGWYFDHLAREIVGGGVSDTVVAPLALGGEYIFRLAALYPSGHHLAVAGGASGSTGAATGGDGSAVGDGGGSDGDGAAVTYVTPSVATAGITLAQGAYSAYSRRTIIVVSGPGAPVNLTVDDVTPNTLKLRWRAPLFDQFAGLWHSDGGTALIGYRVLLRSADEAVADARVNASTRDLEVTLTDLPPQTLWRIQIVAENTQMRGLLTPVLSVATAALRATLWSDCGHRSKVHMPLQYQGCFRDVDTPTSASDMRPAATLPPFSHQLSAALCASACEPFLFFGLRHGGHCACADTFGRYGAVEDHECSVTCTGEANRVCGGGNRTSVYRRDGQHGVMIGVGSYFTYDLIRMRLGIHSLSSVTLPPGLVLTLHSRDELRGMRLNLTQSTSCLASHACNVDEAASQWAEPSPRCANDVWDDETSSLSLSYADGPPTRYTPRPSAETGARAFALGTLGMLARASDLNADVATETNEDRPAGPLAQYWRAPRRGDPSECALRVGGYSSDRICLQAHQMDVPKLQTSWVRANPYTLYEQLAGHQLNSDFSDEFARLKRHEWRATLLEYARPFYIGRVMAGTLDPSVSADEWFPTWFTGLEHLLHLLSIKADGGSPTLGLDDLGQVVSYSAATAPTLPAHPFVPAETRGDGYLARAALSAGGTQEEIRQRLRAQDEIARAGPEAAAATYDTVADPPRGAQGPTHEPMVPYTTPRLQARAAAGSNSAYEAAMRAATVGDAGASGRAGGQEDLPFFGEFT